MSKVNPYHNEHYHQKVHTPEFYEAELPTHDGKKVKVHKIRMVSGSAVIDEIVSAADKKKYPAEYAEFVKKLKPAKKDEK